MQVVDETILNYAVLCVLHKVAPLRGVQGHNNVTLETTHKARQQSLFTERAYFQCPPHIMYLLVYVLIFASGKQAAVQQKHTLKLRRDTGRQQHQAVTRRQGVSNWANFV